MNRSILAVVTVTGILGLAGGWLASGPDEPDVVPAAVAVAAPTPATEPRRSEFPLGPLDVANDRETPALAADASGRVVLAWAAQSGEAERTIHLARSADGGKTFTAPAEFRKVSIYKYTSKSKGKEVAYSTHVLPRLAATADGIYLGWVEAIKGGPEVAYFVARSGDGGSTFEEPIKVHGAEAAKPGFTSLSVARDGTLMAAWLDGRNKGGQQPFFSSRPAGSGGFGADRLVYPGPAGKGICPCCDVAAVKLPDGSAAVAFRDNNGGFRDIVLAVAPPNAPFQAPTPLAPDRWKFDGCPHDGPSLALDADTLHAAWMSAHTGKNRVYTASAPASNLVFKPLEIDPTSPGAQGHPRLVAGGNGSLFAVWDESLGEPPASASHEHSHGHNGANAGGAGRLVKVAKWSATAARFGPSEAVSRRDGTYQLNPAVVVGPDGVALIAWSEIDANAKRVVFARHEAGR